MYCIYRTTNLINGKTYIGQHKYTKLNDDYIGSGILLRRAIEKYGKENFVKEILYSNIQYKETADDVERFAITKERALGKAEYNIADGGNGGNLGEKVNKKISETLKSKRYEPWNKGKKIGPNSEESNRKRSEANKGKIRSEEARQHYLDAAKNRTQEHWEKIRQGRLGKNHTTETRMKMSENSGMRRMSLVYQEYKSNGGVLKWREFLKEYKGVNNNGS